MPENVKPVMMSRPEAMLTETVLEKLIKFGTFEREIDIPGGFKVTMHPLSQEEHEELAKTLVLPKTDKDDTLYTRLESFKIPSLVLAITKIDTQTFNTPEEKQVLRTQLLKVSTVMIDRIWVAYNQLCKDQSDLINGDLKKN